MAFSVPLLSRMNWRGVRVAVSSIRWGPIFKSHSTIEELDNQLSEVLLWFVPMDTVMRRSFDSLWFDNECRIAFDRKRSHIVVGLVVGRMLTGICARSETEACYVSAKARYSERCVARLDASLSPGHWWKALNGPVFRSSSGIPPLQAPGRGLVSDPVAKAELLSSWFDSKQSRVAVGLPSTCHSRPGTRSLRIFLLFFRVTVSLLAPKLSRIIRILLSRGVFPRQWRWAVITTIPKGPLFSLVFGYLPISLTYSVKDLWKTDIHYITLLHGTFWLVPLSSIRL